MDKADFEKILRRQLYGIMFHADAMMIYGVLGMAKQAAEHGKQVLLETKIHNITALLAASTTGQMPDIGPLQKVEIATPEEIEAAKENVASKATLHQKITQHWHKWEMETRDFYNEYIDIDLFRRIRNAVSAECKKASKI